MIHLYAEHLLNIRTLSIQASLSTVSNKETKATLSADGNILTLSHEGETASVKLPINLSPNKQSNVRLTIPAVPSKDLTFRVQLEAKEGVSNGVFNKGAVTGNDRFVPWTADALSNETEIYCRYCGTTSEGAKSDDAKPETTILMRRGAVKVWKDLPSEGWAEMMEFWHCHKPDELENHEHAPLGKGYAAGGQIALHSRVGMVDTMDLLIAQEDCMNIKPSSARHQSDSNDTLLCTRCSSMIGRIDSSSQGYRLRKTQLAISPAHGSTLRSYALEKWYASLLLSVTDSQGVRKITIRDDVDSATTPLKVWLFTPDLRVSSSAAESPEPIKVAKILWQDCEAQVGGTDRLGGPPISEGELTLQNGELAMLRGVLKDSAALLPEGAREFQGWSVGLLPAFSAQDLHAP